jgi:hypothetical protein
MKQLLPSEPSPELTVNQHNTPTNRHLTHAPVTHDGGDEAARRRNPLEVLRQRFGFGRPAPPLIQGTAYSSQQSPRGGEFVGEESDGPPVRFVSVVPAGPELPQHAGHPQHSSPRHSPRGSAGSGAGSRSDGQLPSGSPRQHSPRGAPGRSPRGGSYGERSPRLEGGTHGGHEPARRSRSSGGAGAGSPSHLSPGRSATAASPALRQHQSSVAAAARAAVGRGASATSGAAGLSPRGISPRLIDVNGSAEAAGAQALIGGGAAEEAPPPLPTTPTGGDRGELSHRQPWDGPEAEAGEEPAQQQQEGAPIFSAAPAPVQ